jgi:serine/threonine protein kinase
MKAVSKRYVFASDEVGHILTELSILRRFAESEPRNRFVTRLHYAFTDRENFYFTMRFYPGGDLATQMETHGQLGAMRTRFYAADLVQGIEDVHRHGIIIRDLKPENVLLDESGHAVLADFGLAKEFAYRGEPQAVHVGWYGGCDEPPPWAGKGMGSKRGPKGKVVVDRAMSFVGTCEYLVSRRERERARC